MEGIFVNKKLLTFILLLSILTTAIGMKTTNAYAAYAGEKKYTPQQCVSYAKKAPMLANMKLYRDNHKYYYARYFYSGTVERCLGKNIGKMYFSDFAKKLGGATTKNVKNFKVTKAERELKKLAAGALVSYICTQAGCPWYAGYLLGVAGDKGVDALLRKPGSYRMTNVISSIKAYDRASESYMETYYFRIVGTLEKYDSKTKKWKTISAISNPEFIW